MYPPVFGFKTVLVTYEEIANGRQSDIFQQMPPGLINTLNADELRDLSRTLFQEAIRNTNYTQVRLPRIKGG